MNTAYIIRLTWDSAAHTWRIVLKSTETGTSYVFADLETAFLHVARSCPSQPPTVELPVANQCCP